MSTATLEDFWKWANGRTFVVRGERLRVRVKRYTAIYPYVHEHVQEYADILDGSGDSYDLTAGFGAADDPTQSILGILFARYERALARLAP